MVPYSRSSPILLSHFTISRLGKNANFSVSDKYPLGRPTTSLRREQRGRNSQTPLITLSWFFVSPILRPCLSWPCGTESIGGWRPTQLFQVISGGVTQDQWPFQDTQDRTNFTSTKCHQIKFSSPIRHPSAEAGVCNACRVCSCCPS